MSSRFVSAGAFDVAKPGEAIPIAALAAGAAAEPASSKPAIPSPPTTTHIYAPTPQPPPPPPSPAPAPTPTPAAESKKHQEWLQVSAQLEADRLARDEARKAATAALAGGEKSLFEVLQANKNAKQAAFDEANRLKNQFRALDDDEIDFLDSVRESKRADEERVRRETEEGLRAFRALQRKGGGRVGGDRDGGSEEEEEEGGGLVVGEEEWALVSGRKRRRGEGRRVVGGVGVGVKKRKEGGVEERRRDELLTMAPVAHPAPAAPKIEAKAALPPAAKAKGGLGGLVDYVSSDDDDD
ncbi:N-terminal domain of NEFA-interacting nuclear protein NIP30-domain-containing protein [Podospora appendiculata]|uniref:N-terminal domain of NEFA-interacting nuclear protein NIP30-domain-containing protein n=1 Tax=Podospora appendiculata TaxID=314037 RepID=A0AAE1CC64_9PEZI|nr:N-terminal domain of NEFA-interacting nuclear protein NIP30-domain-containing protein [Podospora appendiculata]